MKKTVQKKPVEQRLEIHPICSLLPSMTDQEYSDLKENIRLRGQQEPIWLSKDGLIIDGRHRYQVCRELSIEPLIKHTRLNGDEAIANVIVALNLRRRHLSVSQLSMVAAQLASIYANAAKERQIAGAIKGNKSDKRKNDSPVSADLQEPGDMHTAVSDAADKVGASNRMTAHSRKVLTKGCPELAQAVMDDIIPASAASGLTKLTEARQLAVIQTIKDGVSKTVKEALARLNIDVGDKYAEPEPEPKELFEVLTIDSTWDTKRIKIIPLLPEGIVWLFVTDEQLLSGKALQELKRWNLVPKALMAMRFDINLPEGMVSPPMAWLYPLVKYIILATRGKPRVMYPLPANLLDSEAEFKSKIANFCPGPYKHLPE